MYIFFLPPFLGEGFSIHFMTFTQKIYYNLFGLPELGPKVHYGRNFYYMNQLEDVTITAPDTGAVLFSQVDTSDEGNNVSYDTVRAGEPIGKIVGCTTTTGDFYLCVKNSRGTFFVDPLYLDASELEAKGVLMASEVDKLRADAPNNASLIPDKLPAVFWAVFALVALIVVLPYTKRK